MGKTSKSSRALNPSSRDQRQHSTRDSNNLVPSRLSTGTGTVTASTVSDPSGLTSVRSVEQEDSDSSSSSSASNNSESIIISL